MTTIKPSLPKAMVFVDGSNFYHRMRDVFGRSDISFKRFIRWLGTDREIAQLFYYTAELPGEKGFEQQKLAQEKFLEYLKNTPDVTIRLGYFQRTPGGLEEKAVDTLIGSDLVTKAHLNEYDQAILVTADGDLVPSVRDVRQLRKQVYIAQFSKLPSYHLRQECDGIIELDCPEVRACLRGPAKI